MEKDKQGDSLNRSTNDNETSPNVITYIVMASFGGFLLGAIVFMALLQEGGMLNPAPAPTATATSIPTDTPTSTPTDTPSSTPTATATSTYTPTPTNTSTNTPTNTPTITPIPPARILKGIQESGQLITIKAERAQIGLEVRYRGNIACEYSATHASVGVIEAGINLEAINADSISYDFSSNAYTIIVPAPTIASCRIEEFDQYIKQGGGTATCFANEWMNMEDIARHLSMKRRLCARGARR